MVGKILVEVELEVVVENYVLGSSLVEMVEIVAVAVVAVEIEVEVVEERMVEIVVVEFVVYVQFPLYP